MRADMSNYAIRQIRPLVQKQHIEQQRQYFEKWAEGRGADATRLTTRWLQKSVVELSKLDRPVKPAVLLQMAYVVSISDMMKVLTFLIWYKEYNINIIFINVYKSSYIIYSIIKY